jgi:hypothetical protein
MTIAGLDKEVSRSTVFTFSIRSGKVHHVGWVLAVNHDRGGWLIGGGLPSLNGMTPTQAIKDATLKELGNASAVVNRSVVELHLLHEEPIGNVGVVAKGLDKQYWPIVRPPRKKVALPGEKALRGGPVTPG